MKIYVNYWNRNMEEDCPFRLSVDKEILEWLKTEMISKALVMLNVERNAEGALNCLKAWEDINDALLEWEEDVKKHEQEKNGEEC